MTTNGELVAYDDYARLAARVEELEQALRYIRDFDDWSDVPAADQLAHVQQHAQSALAKATGQEEEGDE